MKVPSERIESQPQICGEVIVQLELVGVEPCIIVQDVALQGDARPLGSRVDVRHFIIVPSIHFVALLQYYTITYNL